MTKQTGKTLLEIQNSMKLLMETSKLYRPVSARAAKFFFVANDLVKLNKELIIEFLNSEGDDC